MKRWKGKEPGPGRRLKTILLAALALSVAAFLFLVMRMAALPVPPSAHSHAAKRNGGTGPLLPGDTRAPKGRKRIALQDHEAGKEDDVGWDLSRDPILGRVPRARQTTIEVWSRSTGRPVPGALVGYCPIRFGLISHIVRDLPYANRVDWVFEHGFLERADSRGIAKIPLFPSTCFVAARGGGGLGFIETAHSWRWKEDRYRIWIQDVRDLEIQVVDRLGRPVQG